MSTRSLRRWVETTLLCVAGLTGCVVVSDAHSVSVDGQGSNDASLCLTSADGEDWRKAIEGNAEAASRKMFEAGKRDNNRAIFLEWALIAAENGGAKYEFTYAFFLINDNYAANRNRAMFWLGRADAHGSSDAGLLRQKLRSDPMLNPITGRRVKIDIVASARQRAALAGSGGDAYSLCQSMTVFSKDRRYWCRIAAENGDANGFGAYALLLEASDCSSDRVRATFWKNRLSK